MSDMMQMTGSPVDTAGAESAFGRAFIDALLRLDFESLAGRFTDDALFRAVVPSGERRGSGGQEAAGWFKRWFGESLAIEALEVKSAQVFEREYISYRLRLHDPVKGWRRIEQHAYCSLREGRIESMWLVCSGFFSEAPSGRLGADDFYAAGAKGCAEGPIDEIASRLRRMSPGQTLEVQASDPSVTGDLAAWCRLSGNTLAAQDGDRYLIRCQ